MSESFIRKGYIYSIPTLVIMQAFYNRKTDVFYKTFYCSQEYDILPDMVYRECKLCHSKFVGHKTRFYCFTCLPSNLNGVAKTRWLVRARDNWTCQVCGLKKLPTSIGKGAKNLDVHHLNGLCGKRSHKIDKIEDMDGLITLCHKCHFNHPEHRFNLDKINNKLANNLL